MAVLASGGGTNLQALIDRLNGAEEGVARVALVVSDRSGVGALERAAVAGIPTRVVAAKDRDPREVAAELLDAFEEHAIDIVALAGYLRLVPDDVVKAFRGRIVNIHPALLPAFGGPGFYGARVHRAVLESGATVSGATVHLVDEEYDSGRILAQWPVPVLKDDTPDVLAARVLAVEHVLYPAVVAALAARLRGGGGPVAAKGASTAGEQRTATGMHRGGGFGVADRPPTFDQLRALLDL